MSGLEKVTKNFFIWSGLFAAMLYIVLLVTIPAAWLIIGFNSLFVGIVFSIGYTYWRLMADTLWSNETYTRVRLFAMTNALVWLSLSLLIFTSVISTAAGRDPWYFTAPVGVLARYLALIAGIGQILAPGLERGFLHGEEKRVVWAGVFGGLMIAVVTIIVQSFEISPV